MVPVTRAECNASDAWDIPVAALVETGVWPSTTPPDLEAEVAEPAASDALESRNADDLRTALRMLEAAPTPPPAPRRRWWNRAEPTTEPTTLTPNAED